MNRCIRSDFSLKARLCLFLFIIARVYTVQAQPPSNTVKFSPVLDANINGFWEYLPRNYNRDLSKAYPLLIFLHGFPDSGSTPDTLTLSKVLNAGTPSLIKKGLFPDSFYVDNTWYKFIVISPQIKNGYTGDTKQSRVDPSTIDALINYATTTYRVDTTRIYLCGLSMGGGIAINYAGSSAAAAGRLAAVGMAAGAAELDTIQTDNIADSYMAVLATHNTIDDLIPVSLTIDNMAKLVNSKDKVRRKNLVNKPAVDPDPAVFYWNTPDLNDNHNAWGRTFEDITPEVISGGSLIDIIGITVYHWMLKYSKTAESILPVEWQSFTVQEANKNVLLQWSTGKELNVKSFIVEKSQNGLSWSSITTLLPSLGNGPVKAYSYFDTDPYAGVNYYRIRQIDQDGNFRYSIVKKISINSLSGLVIKLYPNPFDREVSLVFPQLGESMSVTVKIADSHGSIIATGKYQVQQGTSTVSLKNLQGLSSGLYTIRIQDAQGRILANEKVVKQ